MITTQDLDLTLPLKIDSVKSVIRWVSFAIIALCVIAVVVLMMVNRESQLHLIPTFIVLGYAGLLLVYYIVMKIVTAVIKNKATIKLEAWLKNKYGYSVHNRKQLLPLLKHDWSEGRSGYASNAVFLWDSIGSMETAVPFMLKETNTGYSLFNLNTKEPELPTELKKAVEYWEFFWSFNDGIYIPVPKDTKTDIPNEFVNFASPLEEFKIIKIWGEEASFREAWEKDELPYSIASVPNMQALAKWLYQFKEDNIIVELEIQGRQTRIPVLALTNAINLVYSGR